METFVQRLFLFLGFLTIVPAQAHSQGPGPLGIVAHRGTEVGLGSSHSFGLLRKAHSLTPGESRALVFGLIGFAVGAALASGFSDGHTSLGGVIKGGLIFAVPFAAVGAFLGR